MGKLTERQFEVLNELHGCDRAKYGGRHYRYPSGEMVRMFDPLDFGGSNGSHHSGTATALAKLGLVDRLKTQSLGLGPSQLNLFNSRSKGACHYRITDAGVVALTEEHARRRQEPTP